MSGESGEELCRRLAGRMGCNVNEIRDKETDEIKHGIYSMLPQEIEYSEKEILDIIKRLEDAGCVPRDLHDELGPPDPDEDEDEDEEDLDEDT
ncbi:MAG: hypothetical protein WBZ36_12055 [Candidatus Nitrosopolaris sp.]